MVHRMPAAITAVTSYVARPPATNGSGGLKPGNADATQFWRDVAVERDVFSRWLVAQGAPAHAGPALPAAGGESSLQMALRPARQALAEENIKPEDVDILIHFYSMMDENPAWSGACFLHHELGCRRAIPFSITQKGGAAGMAALQTAMEMFTAEPDIETILLVGSDKWIPPYQASFGGIRTGSGSSALVMRRSGHEGLRPLGVWLKDGLTSGDRPIDARMIADQAVACLRDQGVLADRVSHWILPAGLERLYESVAEQAGAPSGAIFRPASLDETYLPATAPLLQLGRAIEAHCMAPGDLVLMFGFGYGASAGCALLEVI